jgi:hypothetical protein
MTAPGATRVIHDGSSRTWEGLRTGAEGNTRLASFINRVTAQHVEWIEQLRQDILATANDWALRDRHS